jgi:hypothetical protein
VPAKGVYWLHVWQAAAKAHINGMISRAAIGGWVEETLPLQHWTGPQVKSAFISGLYKLGLCNTLNAHMHQQAKAWFGTEDGA